MASCSEMCGSGQGPAHDSCQRYGVRSYLHHFYEECTASIWERDEDFQVQRSPRRWSSVLWKVSLAFGTLMLIAGLITLTVGYAVPSKIEAFGEGEMVFVDSQAVRFNQGLHLSKLAGAALFCAGGILMAVGLLLSAFAKSHSKDEAYLQHKFKETIADMHAAAAHPITKAPTPGESKIPVTLSKVQNVQPTS
ncbi:neurensin 1-like [Anguilla rostrata]|uniref:neurensin 1-like n=1 Tax=Anguilla rostrata TaxID=7938 RepID=UPI0030D130D9